MTTWEMFETAVKGEFQPLDNEKVARDKLADLVQIRSVSAYVGVMRDLRIQISDLSDKDLLHKFTRGLKPNIRKEVELRDPTTLDDAIKIAERADVMEMGHRTNRRPPSNYYNGGQRQTPANNFGGQRQQGFNGPRQFNQGRYNGPAPMELGAMQGTRDNRRTDYTNVECYNCHQKGHIARRCPNVHANNSTKAGRQ